MLDQRTIDRALNVKGQPHEAISRTVIDGVVIIYDLNDPPRWVQLLDAAQDENGNLPRDAEVVVKVPVQL